LKKFNLSIAWFSFLFPLAIVFLFAIVAHFYIKESISILKRNDEHFISCYANRVTTHKQSIKEFKELIFGTLESFKYKVAIIDSKNKLLYTTFNRTPLYDFSNRTYIKDNKVYYNGIKDFSDVGNVKIIFGAALDYSEIKIKIIIILMSGLIFLIACSLFLYHHITDIYTNISKKLDLFFKDAIHEIRTPLGVIQINLDFLENTMENSMPLKRAQGGVRNLTSVYESIEYSIKHQKVKYAKNDIDLSKFLQTRIEFFQVLADIKNIDIQRDIEKDIYIYISRVELQRLIDNNISNAIKYSKANTQIEIKLQKEKCFVNLNFSNYGEYIENTSEIFKRYYRGDNFKGGFGLGLSIVQNICKDYNIDVKVTSKEDGKSTFLYKIPNKMTLSGNQND
jgi:hypothetical protein